MRTGIKMNPEKDAIDCFVHYSGHDYYFRYRTDGVFFRSPGDQYIIYTHTRGNQQYK